MNNIERESLNNELTLRHKLLRFQMGFRKLRQDKSKCLILIAFYLLLYIFWTFRNPIFCLDRMGPFALLIEVMVAALVLLCAIAGPFLLIILIGTPRGANTITNDLRRTGLFNRAGEAPLLVERYKDNTNSRITVLEFESWGIPRSEWEDKQEKIEAALNVHVAKISDGSNKRRVLLHTIRTDYELPSVLYWKKKYLSSDSFVLVLGENLLGPVTVNLDIIPHILLGGSTGSGKSVLLKLLLMQAIQKGAIVSIADFKGGVDFPAVWHKYCQMCFEETELLNLLTSLVDELQRRKAVFKDNDVRDIDAFNKITGSNLHRLVFACDEVSEVLDKTGLTKEQKELISQIESKLSKIARQGRSFGIHLILATQRPDATILSGQIRNNIDFRVCGRADNVLSQIILDNTSAADLIPKDSRGHFILHDGTIFQSYLFDEATF